MKSIRHTPKPGNPLKDVKDKIRAGNYEINSNAIEDAWNCFRWNEHDVKKCLLKLNDLYYDHDKMKNHFYKEEEHSRIPRAVMDYYKAHSIMDGEDVYLHLYVHPLSHKVIISSFKRL